MSKTYTISVNKNETNVKNRSNVAGEIAKKSKIYEVEKTLLSSEKKNVKKDISKVSSYADITIENSKRVIKQTQISTEKDAVIEKIIQKVKKAVKNNEIKDTIKKPKVVKQTSKKTEKEIKAEPVVEKEKTTAESLKIPTENVARSNVILAEVSERYNYCLDDDAQRIVSVARMGSLFDYQKII